MKEEKVLIEEKVKERPKTPPPIILSRAADEKIETFVGHFSPVSLVERIESISRSSSTIPEQEDDDEAEIEEIGHVTTSKEHHLVSSQSLDANHRWSNPRSNRYKATVNIDIDRT